MILQWLHTVILRIVNFELQYHVRTTRGQFKGGFTIYAGLSVAMQSSALRHFTIDWLCDVQHVRVLVMIYNTSPTYCVCQAPPINVEGVYQLWEKAWKVTHSLWIQQARRRKNFFWCCWPQCSNKKGNGKSNWRGFARYSPNEGNKGSTTIYSKRWGWLILNLTFPIFECQKNVLIVSFQRCVSSICN